MTQLEPNKQIRWLIPEYRFESLLSRQFRTKHVGIEQTNQHIDVMFAMSTIVCNTTTFHYVHKKGCTPDDKRQQAYRVLHTQTNTHKKTRKQTCQRRTQRTQPAANANMWQIAARWPEHQLERHDSDYATSAAELIACNVRIFNRTDTACGNQARRKNVCVVCTGHIYFGIATSNNGIVLGFVRELNGEHSVRLYVINKANIKLIFYGR